MSAIEQVRAFHEKFGLPIRDAPKKPSRTERVLIARLIMEEAREAAQAVLCGSSIGTVAGETSDLIYVAYGAALRYGYDQDAALAEVHRSNMGKVWADGMARYRPDGKVEKGPDWKPPDMMRAIGVE